MFARNAADVFAAAWLLRVSCAHCGPRSVLDICSCRAARDVGPVSASRMFRRSLADSFTACAAMSPASSTPISRSFAASVPKPFPAMMLMLSRNVFHFAFDAWVSRVAVTHAGGPTVFPSDSVRSARNCS